MGPKAWLKLVLLDISRQTPAYRSANLDWRWNLQTGRSISVVRRWFGVMFGVLIAGFARLTTGAIGLAQATEKQTTVVVESRSAPATGIFTGSPSSRASAISPSGLSTLPAPTRPTTLFEPPLAGSGGLGGGFSSLFLAAGSVLVLLGIAAIVLIVWRRREERQR